MKLLKAVHEWLREYKPESDFKRINGSNNKISVIIEHSGRFELIEFELVSGKLVASIDSYEGSNV